MFRLTDIIAASKNIGEKIQEEWSQNLTDLNYLAKLAERTLLDTQFPTPPTMSELIKDLNNPDLSIYQTFVGTQFSDLPLTLYSNAHFVIDLYYWYNKDTSIHNHHFVGAFKVIHGQSSHVTFKFEEKKNLTPEITEGILTRAKTELLTTGDVRPINFLNDFIHQVIHLEAPTITLCLRSKNSENSALSFFIYPKYKVSFFILSSRLEKILAGIRCLSAEEVKQLDMTIFTPFEIISLLPTLKPGEKNSDNILLEKFEEQFLKNNIALDFFDFWRRQSKVTKYEKKFRATIKRIE